MVDGQPERERFFDVVGPVLDRATRAGRTVRAFGEMVALLAEAGNHVGAVKLELLWEEMQIARQFTLYCAYPINLFGSVELASAMDRVAASHGRVIPAESYTERASDDERLRAILDLAAEGAGARSGDCAAQADRGPAARIARRRAGGP